MPPIPASTTTISPAPVEHRTYPQPFRSITNGRSQLWNPISTLPFEGSSSGFVSAIDEMISHPEHTSGWILRAEILYNSSEPLPVPPDLEPQSISVPFFTITNTRTRRLLPRNPATDGVATQTILQLSSNDDTFRELFLLLPHGDLDSLPWYLPRVAGVGFLFTPSAPPTSPPSTSPNHAPSTPSHCITLLYAYYSTAPPTLPARLSRTALQLLTRAKKLGENPDYQKRVHHDVIIRRETYQDRYIELRARHAKRLLEGWRESTDPRKHVFEDIGIAAFLVCLWEETYWRPQEGNTAEISLAESEGSVKREWVGFVDVGCGNGVLVDILIREGWSGFGFDARARKSWDGFDASTRAALKEGILVPWLLPGAPSDAEWEKGLNNGRFAPGTFIIANHADELTGWAPVLAKACDGAFLAIPCCSHDLSGAKRRFTAAKDAVDGDDGITGDLTRMRGHSTSKSTYAGLVAWTLRLAADMWEVETETLRIPSTRNVGIVGRRLRKDGLGVEEILAREGGAVGWVERAEKLKKAEAKGH